MLHLRLCPNSSMILPRLASCYQVKFDCRLTRLYRQRDRQTREQTQNKQGNKQTNKHNKWVYRFLTAHQHNSAIQCHSRRYTLENTWQKTNEEQWLQKLNTTQKKQTTQNTAIGQERGGLILQGSPSQTRREWVSSVLRPLPHSIGYMGDGFYRSKDPTNSIKVLKEDQ